MVNAMLVAQTMTGADGIRAVGLPGDRVVEVLRKYNRNEVAQAMRRGLTCRWSAPLKSDRSTADR